MKVQELRVGNYYDHNGEVKIVSPSTIEEVWTAERSWCKPVPLTREWGSKLHKDHFTFNSFASRIVYECNKFKTIKYEFFTKSVIVFLNDELVGKFDYVHEWQNFHRALTKEELIFNQ